MCVDGASKPINIVDIIMKLFKALSLLERPNKGFDTEGIGMLNITIPIKDVNMAIKIMSKAK